MTACYFDVVLSPKTQTNLKSAKGYFEEHLSVRNLRALLLAIQDFAVKWVCVVPERYQQLEARENGVVSSISIQEAK